MAGTGCSSPELSEIIAQAEPKRRKLRKGTLSCWSCKRRKIRCSFRAPTDTVCDGCESRGLPCVSQEFPDNSIPSMRGKHVKLRLDRMEAVVQTLTEEIETSQSPADSEQPRIDHDHSAPGPGISSQPIRTKQRTVVRHPLPWPPFTAMLTLCQPSARPVNDSSSDYLLQFSDPRINRPSVRIERDIKDNSLSYSVLSEAWPCQKDLDLILAAPIDTSVIFHGTICTPYSDFMSQEPPSLKDLLHLPPSGSHPVLVARRLLILATLLQGVPLQPPNTLAELSLSHHEIMSRAADTAIRHVTSNDELVGCVEGIECIMIEGMYHNNAGNLRRSWLAIRRAMTTAQMMRLHCNPDWSSARTLELETRSRLSLEHLWYRLVQSDRYLSLMLGLPPGSLEDNFAAPKAMENCIPMERMERLQSVAGGRILQRRPADLHDVGAMHEIDQLLQSAAAIMPAQWWLIPDLGPKLGHGMDALRETIRMMNQFAHYIILLQLHLPYMLYSSLEGKFDYSRITAVNASRELLARFVSFRSCSPSTAYCRGVDFLAFIASTALCLAHINASRQQQSCADGSQWGGAFSFLFHQRLGDRGMMERALECLELTAGAGSDVLASKVASILQHLLIIEGDAANGSAYNAKSVLESAQPEPGCNGQVQDGGNVLHISIPYFGTVEIKRSGVSRSPSLLPNRQENDDHIVLPTGPAGYTIGTQSSNSDWQTVPYDSGCQARIDTATETNNSLSTSDNTGSLDMDLTVPGLGVNVEEWELQGVDMAVFNTLLQGAELDSTPCDSWSL